MRPLGAVLATTAAALAIAATPAAPAAALSETTSFQGDAAHTGGVVDPALDGPLQVRWSSRLAQGASAPLVAGGRVFVLSPAANGNEDLVALDAATGRELWRQSVEAPEGMTYGGGAVYVLKQFGSLVALDAATGRPRWHRDTATYEVSNVVMAPAYFGGTVFYTGLNSASQTRVVAVSAVDGTPLWQSASLPYGAWDAAVAVDAQGVFISNQCDYATSLTLSGAKRWETVPGCNGSTFHTQTVVLGTRAFPAFASGAVLDTTTGRTVDELVQPFDGAVQAFGLHYAALLRDRQLTIVDRTTLTTVGRYPGDAAVAAELRVQPFFVGDRVFTVDSAHHLIGVDAATATLSADLDLDSQLPAVPGHEAESPKDGGIGVGGGVLAVVTADGRVVAVTAADGPPPAAAPAATTPAATEPRSQIPAAALRVTFPDGAKLRALRGRGLAVAIAGARPGATVRATVTVGDTVVWRGPATRVPRSGRLRVKAARRTFRTARIALRVTAPRATPLVLRRALR